MGCLAQRACTASFLVSLSVVPALSCDALYGKVGRWNWARYNDASYSVSTAVDVGKVPDVDDLFDAGTLHFSSKGHGDTYATLSSLDDPVQRLTFSVDGKKEVEITEKDKAEWNGQRFDQTIAALRSGKRISMDYVIKGRAFKVDFMGSEFSKAYEASQTPCN